MSVNNIGDAMIRIVIDALLATGVVFVVALVIALVVAVDLP